MYSIRILSPTAALPLIGRFQIIVREKVDYGKDEYEWCLGASEFIMDGFRLL